MYIHEQNFWQNSKTPTTPPQRSPTEHMDLNVYACLLVQTGLPVLFFAIPPDGLSSGRTQSPDGVLLQFCLHLFRRANFTGVLPLKIHKHVGAGQNYTQDQKQRPQSYPPLQRAGFTAAF